MTETNRRGNTGFHEQLTLASATVGAITFAALILIIQDKSDFVKSQFSFITATETFAFLTLLLAAVSVLAMMSCLATTFTGSGIIPESSPLGTFAYIAAILSFAGFIFGSLFIVFDVSIRGSFVFVFFLVIVIGGFLVSFAKSFKHKT